MTIKPREPGLKQDPQRPLINTWGWGEGPGSSSRYHTQNTSPASEPTRLSQPSLKTRFILASKFYANVGKRLKPARLLLSNIVREKNDNCRPSASPIHPVIKANKINGSLDIHSVSFNPNLTRRISCSCSNAIHSILNRFGWNWFNVMNSFHVSEFITRFIKKSTQCPHAPVKRYTTSHSSPRSMSNFVRYA